MDNNGHGHFCPKRRCRTRMLMTYDWGVWAVCPRCGYAECLEEGYYPIKKSIEESISVPAEEKKAVTVNLSPATAQSLI